MPWRPSLDRSQVRVGRLGIAVRRFTFLHNQPSMAHRLTLQRFARLLLAWYVAFVGVGTTGWLMGWKLHHWRRKARVSAQEAVADADAAGAGPARGSCAPWRIHSAKLAMTRVSSFAPFLGI